MTNIRKQALALLRSAHFFFMLLGALRKNGLVGEERNAQVVYVVATSRILDRPLCLFVKGPSGVGKNFLTDKVFGLLPSSAIQQLTSSSARSWNYIGKRLAHRVVYVKERNDASGSVDPTRLLISEKELIHTVTVKKNGRFVTERRVTKGPIASVSTTTQDRVTVDDETRHISIWLDESPEQTSRIMEAAVEQTGALTPGEVRIWHAVQALIADRAVRTIELPEWFKDIVPYVRNENLWARRYFSAFVQACKTVALIRSFRRKKGSQKKAITVRFIDFAITALIFNPVFDHSIDKANDDDLEVQNYVKRISARNDGEGVCAADLIDEMRVSEDRAYALLRKAVKAGTIVRANEPEKSNVKLYLPAKRRLFLPDPEEIFQKISSLPDQIRFVHPVSGEWVTYRRKSKR